MQPPLSDEQAQAKIVDIAQTFSPNAPVSTRDLFAGRIDQLLKVINAVYQRGQHVIIYGERGVGKTSLANIISPALRSKAIVARQNCNQLTTFPSLWHNVLRQITQCSEHPEIGFTSDTRKMVHTMDSKLGERVTPEDIRHIFSALPKAVLVFDELDRIADEDTKTLMADTIKSLSDHSVDTTVVLVGVADSVDNLIAAHQSVERALVQVHMPRMSVAELYEIVDRGLSGLDMSIDASARTLIADLSQGLPHYTHLLALHSSQRAVLQGKLHVTHDDVIAAMERAVTDAQQSIISSYHQATNSPRANLFPQVLLACALAPTDTLGYFSAADVRNPMRVITGKDYNIPAFAQHLKEFCEMERGPILERTGYPRRYRFRFVNPLMEPYVIMNGVATGLIKDTNAIGGRVAQKELY
ncbi:MAG: ATP-binding protein [Thermoanaerobaculia bacterium]|nr:ATP-binding protein [Thermoanaerobaculia bacterium]